MNKVIQPYLTTLTPLRGIAAMLIVIYHCNGFLVKFIPPGSTFFFTNTYLWVDFFFILSGFVMSYVYGNNFTKKVDRTSFKNFIGARFARIYPLYLFTLCWGAIAAAAILKLANRLDPAPAALFNLKAIPACLILVQGLHLYIVAPLNGVAWSLSTEWWVYFIFPFLAPLLTIYRTFLKIGTAVALLVAYLLVMYLLGPIAAPVYNGIPKLDITVDYGIVRCFIGFLTGMFLFILYQAQTGKSMLANDWFFITILCCIFVSSHLGFNDVFIVFLMSLLLLSAAYNTTRVKKVLDMRVFQRLGDWSFSIYMVHGLVITIFILLFLSKNPDMLYNMDASANEPPQYKVGLIMAVIALLLTLVISALTYRFIELPGRNFLNQVLKTQRKKLQTQSFKV